MKHRIHALIVLSIMLLLTFFAISCSNNDSSNLIVKPHSGVRDDATVNNPPVDPESLPHRGRIQIQGNDMNPEKSSAWSLYSPLTKQDGLNRLDALYNALTTRQKEDRVQAYAKAKAFISAAPSTGYSAVIRRTFQNSPVRDNTIRIDIEILAGNAFIDD